MLSITNLTKILIPISLCIFFLSSETVSGYDESGPKFVNVKDIHSSAKNPTKIWFPIKAIDSKNNSLMIQCDKTQGSVFKVGKTTVRCLATDSLGNEARASFTVTVGYNIVDIPEWLKYPTSY